MDILCSQFYADVPAACQDRCRAGTAAAREWIEHQLTLQREAANQRSQRLYWLLRRMQLVAAVRHIHYVCEWLLRQRRSALRQQKCLLMLIAEKPALRAVGLAEHDVSDRLKTRLFPRREEGIDLRPAIEHNGHAIHLEYPVRFAHRGLEPVGVDVVLDAATATVSVVHQIRGIGENEIDAVCWYLAHDLDAIALRDAVDVPILNCSLCLHNLDLLCGPVVISQDTHPEGARDGRSQGGGMLFRGRPSGGAETRRTSAGPHAR